MSSTAVTMAGANSFAEARNPSKGTSKPRVKLSPHTGDVTARVKRNR